MSTLRISNIEAKADNSSPTVDEQLKFTNSTGDVLLHLDGRTSGITTVGINTTAQTIKFDENNNVYITGIVTATELHGTVAVGTSVTYGDNEKAYFGTGLDLKIHHTSGNSFIENGTGTLKIRGSVIELSNPSAAQMLQANSTAAVNLYFNGNKKFETTNAGISVTGQGVFSAAITASTYIQGTSSNGGLKFYSDSSASRGVTLNTDDHLIPSHDSNSDLGLTGTRWRNVYADTLYGDGSNLTGIEGGVAGINTVGLSTFKDILVSGISTFHDTINFNSTSSKRLYLYKDGNDEFSIYNSSGYAYITHKKSSYLLQIQTNHQVKIGSAQSPWRTSATFQPSGSVELYHINDKKFSTTSYGISVHGLSSSNTEGGRIDFTNATTSNWSNNAWARITNDGVNGVSQLQFWTQASGGSLTERLRIDSNGYLSFAGDTNTYIHHPSSDQLAITRAGGSEPIIRFGTGGGGSTVGISTTLNMVTNAEKLAIRGYSSFKSVHKDYAALYVGNEGNTNNNSNMLIGFHDGTANRGAIGYTKNTGELRFNNQYYITFTTGAASLGGTERLRIASGGSVNIGGQYTQTVHQLSVNKSNGSCIQLGNTSGTGAGSHDAQIVASDGSNFNNLKIGGHETKVFANVSGGTGYAETWRFDSSGNLACKIAGKGIDFSATSHTNPTGDGEVLTTYEEGVWTPQPMFSGGNTGISANVDGYYVRVGKMVTCYYQIIFTNKGSSTGDFQIGGFPFSNSATEFTNPGFGYFHRLSFSESSDHVITCNLSGTTSSWRRAQYGSGVHNMATVTNSHINSSTHIAGSLIYRAA